MKKIILIALLFPLLHFGQEYKKEFNTLCKDRIKNKEEIVTLLKDWEGKSKTDIDYYIAAFNFYYIESKQEILSLTSIKPSENEESFVLKDSLNNPVGYLYGQESRNDSVFTLSQEIIDKAIVLFPNRLDLRFGKIHTLGDYGDFDSFSKAIIESIDYGIKIKHQWLWAENEKLENPEDFFIDAVQSYQSTLFNEKSDANLKKVASKMYEVFPHDIYVISSYGLTLLIENKNEEALKLYFIAEKLNPEDLIVLGNIGLIYERLKKKEKAIAYYRKMYEVGDEETKAFATNKIKSLTE